jgi:hypothetical protein
MRKIKQKKIVLLDILYLYYLLAYFAHSDIIVIS